MNALSAQNAIPEVTIHGGKVVTTSLAVAEYFQKTHDNVLKKIRSIVSECGEEYRLVNFNETSYARENPNGGGGISTPIFELTRDAFVLIAMGFTGKKALQWKINYINAFNRMEAELIERHSQPAITPIFPPTGQRYTYTVGVDTDGTVTAIQLIKPGYILIHPRDSIEMLRRHGYVVCRHKELRTAQIDHIGRMCDESAKMEAEWILANRRSQLIDTSF